MSITADRSVRSVRQQAETAKRRPPTRERRRYRSQENPVRQKYGIDHLNQAVGLEQVRYRHRGSATLFILPYHALAGHGRDQSAAAYRPKRRLPVPGLYFLLQLGSAQPASDNVIGKHFRQCILILRILRLQQVLDGARRKFPKGLVRGSKKR